MADARTIVVAAVLAAALTYGGLLTVEALGDGGLVAPQTDAITVQGTTYHLDRTGRPTVVGEVWNGRSYPVENVTVTVTFYADGEAVGTTSDTVVTDGIPAGETAPFDIHYGTDATVTDYEVTVTADRGTRDHHALSGSAEIVNEGQNRVTVSGTVENHGDDPTPARVIVTFYDENDSVIGVRTTMPAGTVHPGDTTPFTVHFETLGDVPSLAQEFDHYTVMVEPAPATTARYTAAGATTERAPDRVRRVRPTPG